jgi:TRAP-type C4-dicarboxylate transport system permease small subunit
MDFVTSKLPQGLERILHSATRILGIILFAVIGSNLMAFGSDFRRVGEVTPTLQIPLYPAAYGIAFCCLIECLVLIVQLSEWKETQG